ncbi:MAG: hypothetical protein ACYC7I_10655 [Gammaproteobacteria bacterium]
MAAELSFHLRSRLLSIGSFPASLIARDTIADRILGPIREPPRGFDDTFFIQEEIVAQHFSPAAVQAATVALLRPPAPLDAPPQYAVFNLTRNRHSLINFNNDGLADRFCGTHTVINVHGTSLGAEQRTILDWERVIDAFQEYPELRPIVIPGLLLPQKEPETIAKTFPYPVAKQLLKSARRLILVGYSFGGMDDWIAYEMITSAVRDMRLDTVVLQPDALDLATRIAQEGKIDSVAPLSMCWDKISAAIIAALGRPRYKSCDHTRLCLRCVSYLYCGLANGGKTKGEPPVC